MSGGAEAWLVAGVESAEKEGEETVGELEGPEADGVVGAHFGSLAGFEVGAAEAFPGADADVVEGLEDEFGLARVQGPVEGVGVFGAGRGGGEEFVDGCGERLAVFVEGELEVGLGIGVTGDGACIAEEGAGAPGEVGSESEEGGEDLVFAPVEAEQKAIVLALDEFHPSVDARR